MKKLLLIAGLYLLTVNLFAQDGFKDDFNTDPLGSGWYTNTHYSLTQSDGALKIGAHKSAMWAGFGVNIPLSDVRAQPVLNLKIKTDNPVQLTAYLLSDLGNVLITIPVMATTDYQTICYDFTGLDVNSNVLNAVNGILFAFNGGALTWSGDVYFDEVSLGSEAVKYANVGGLSDMVFFQGTTGHRVFIRGIKNVASLSLTGADALVENVSFDTISSTGTSWMNFDCKAGVNSSAIVTLNATGTAGYTNYGTTFKLDVEGNKPPTVDAVANMQASVGNKSTVSLSGITDGNGSVEQDVAITAESGNLAVIDNNITVKYDAGSSYATIEFTPVGAGTATITLTLDDQQATDNLFQTTFDVEVLASWNNKPTIQNIPNLQFLNNAGEQSITLSGISDGDNGTQAVTITATSSDPTIIPDPVVEYTSGATGTLKVTPVPAKTGIITITITLTDDGGIAGNNGNQSSVKTFNIETYDPPLNGYVIPFENDPPNAFDAAQPGLRDYWYVEGLGATQVVTHDTDGAEDVFKIVCNGKSTWSGSWYYTPDMDLTDFPLLSMWVKCDQAIKFHLYFWDDSIRNNENSELEFDIPANTWTKCDFDFSTPGGMLNGKGELVNAKRIQKVLFNYHPTFGWPFTTWNGTVMFKDVRIGDQSGITPTYYCTIDPVGPQTCFKDANPGTINLKGLSRTKDNVVSASVAGKGVVTGLSVSSVVNGAATITYTPSVVGNDTLTVTVSGAAINGKLPVSKEIKIPVSVVDKNAAAAGSATVNLSETHQIYRGLGGMTPGISLLDLYTTYGFGATAVRIMVGDDNQIEPLNDNDDPNVLDMSKLNKGAFNWNEIRGLKANGVETFLLTYWSPPAWMKENLSTNFQQPAASMWEYSDNKVMLEMYDEYAEDVVAAVKLFKQEADVDLTAIGLQNEPAFCEPYASAILSPTHFAEMIAKVGKRFEEEGITTKLYMAEQVGARMSDGPIYSNQSYLDAIDANPDAKKYSDIFAVHGYGADGVAPGVTPGSADWANTFAAVNANGKTRQLWMTETSPPSDGWNDDFINAGNIVTAFESGNVGLWTEWAWDGVCIDHGKPTQKYWAQSMFKHIKPGAVRLTSASGNNDILITTWKNDANHNNNIVMVLLNKGNTPLTISIDQTNLPGTYELYRCSENVDAFRDADYNKGDKLLIGARSIVTLVSGSYSIPVVDGLSDSQVMIDAGQQMVNLTGISDGNLVNENPIEVTYSLSDNTIISGVSISYLSPANSGTFTYTPAKAGSTEVTIQVTANGVSTTTKFTIQVNDYFVPHIDAVAGSHDYEMGSGTKTINLTGINDGGDGGQTLEVAAAVKSSVPDGVVGNLAVTYSSPAATGSLSFTPELEGTATIEITVTDNGPEGKNTTTSEFIVTVFAHHPPTVGQQNDTTLVTGTEATILLIGVTAGGDDDNITSITAESSDETVTGSLSTSLSQKTVKLTPLTKGTATITVTITDNGPEGLNSTEMSFDVTVNFPDAIPGINTADILVYPNPVADHLTVTVPANLFVRYTVISSNGSVLQNGKFTGTKFEIQTSNLAKGNYLLILEGEKGNAVKHFVK